MPPGGAAVFGGGLAADYSFRAQMKESNIFG